MTLQETYTLRDDGMIRNEKLLKSIADARIERLFGLAKGRIMLNGHSDGLSRRYIGIADSIISHYKVSPGLHMKREVCKKCKSVLIPGMNCAVRLVSDKGYAAVKCECGEDKHIFYK